MNGVLKIFLINYFKKVLILHNIFIENIKYKNMLPFNFLIKYFLNQLIMLLAHWVLANLSPYI